MSQEERWKLARSQSEVLAAIFSGGALPGAAGGQLAHAAAVLRGKRRREAALAAPRLAEALGDSFAARFDDYARRVGFPGRGGPPADAAAFGGYLKGQNLLPPIAMMEHWVLVGLTCRRLQIRVWRGRIVLLMRWRGRVRILRLA